MVSSCQCQSLAAFTSRSLQVFVSDLGQLGNPSAGQQDSDNVARVAGAKHRKAVC